jgi:hypothetical protein
LSLDVTVSHVAEKVGCNSKMIVTTRDTLMLQEACSKPLATSHDF